MSIAGGNERLKQVSMVSGDFACLRLHVSSDHEWSRAFMAIYEPQGRPVSSLRNNLERLCAHIQPCVQAVLAAATICITMQFVYFLHTPADMPADEIPDALKRLAMAFGRAQTKCAGGIRTAGSFVQSGLSLEEVCAVAAAGLSAHKYRHGGRSPVPACQCSSWFSWLVLARCSSRLGVGSDSARLA